jgi:hypothetical protein
MWRCRQDSVRAALPPVFGGERVSGAGMGRGMGESTLGGREGDTHEDGRAPARARRRRSTPSCCGRRGGQRVRCRMPGGAAVSACRMQPTTPHLPVPRVSAPCSPDRTRARQCPGPDAEHLSHRAVLNWADEDSTRARRASPARMHGGGREGGGGGPGTGRAMASDPLSGSTGAAGGAPAADRAARGRADPRGAGGSVAG